ncbi:DUF551 domain-containing protein [Dysosmobacter welbionis]
MARPIDGDALKRWCEKIIDQACHPATVQIGEVFLDKVRSMPTLAPSNEWVSVEERLPTDERPVLVFIGYADTMTGFITTSSYFCFDANPHWQWDGLTQDEQKTLFWMPLPDPPGKEKAITALSRPNEPLTIEQLREMGGQPYWHVGLREESPPPHWNILDPFYAKHIEDYRYGENWLAYRRPLEGETDA